MSRINWKLLSLVLIATTIVISTMLAASQLNVSSIQSLPVAEAHFSTPHNTVHSESVIDNSLYSADLGVNSVGASELATNSVGDYELVDDLSYSGRLAYTPFLKTVPFNALSSPAIFGLSDTEVIVNNFVQIDCNDPDGCVIPSTSVATGINAGLPGQILIISTADSVDVTINEQLSPAAGVIQVNLAATSRTLSERGDTLMLLFHDGEWNELNFQSVGPP